MYEVVIKVRTEVEAAKLQEYAKLQDQVVAKGGELANLPPIDIGQIDAQIQQLKELAQALEAAQKAAATPIQPVQVQAAYIPPMPVYIPPPYVPPYTPPAPPQQSPWNDPGFSPIRLRRCKRARNRYCS